MQLSAGSPKQSDGTHAGRYLHRWHDGFPTHTGHLIQRCLKVVNLHIEGNIAAHRHILSCGKHAATDAALVCGHQTVVAHVFALHVDLPSEQVAIELLQGRPIWAGNFKVHYWVSHCLPPSGLRISLGRSVSLDATTCQSSSLAS